MKVIYSELYAKDKNDNGYCFPTLEFYYTYDEKSLIPNSKYIYEIKDDEVDLYTAYLPFFHSFFDGLKEETKAKLNSIYEFAFKYGKYNYICKKIWKSFLFTTNIKINNIQTNYNTHLLHIENENSKRPLYKKYNSKSEEQLKVESYYKNELATYDGNISNLQYGIYTKLTNHFSNNIKPTLKEKYINTTPKFNDIFALSIMKRGAFGGIINIDYEFEYKNELELLYTFLNCLFLSDYDYKIKKCKECQNFYITLNANSKHCPFCLPTIKKLQKQNYENNDLIKLERRINQLFYAPNRVKDKEKYLIEKRNKKKQLINNEISEKEFETWLISHYRSKYK